jgi:hypothetical protein
VLAGSHDDNGSAFVEIAAAGEVVDQCAVELREANFFCSRRATSSSINRARNSV